MGTKGSIRRLFVPFVIFCSNQIGKLFWTMSLNRLRTARSETLDCRHVHQNVGELARPPDLWRGVAQAPFGAREGESITPSKQVASAEKRRERAMSHWSRSFECESTLSPHARITKHFL